MKRNASLLFRRLICAALLFTAGVETTLGGELRGRGGSRPIRKVAAQEAMPAEEDAPPAATQEAPAPRATAPRATGPRNNAAPAAKPPVYRSAPSQNIGPIDNYRWEEEGVPHHHSGGMSKHGYLDDFCDDGSCEPCVAPCSSRAWWGSAEYLLWWRRQRNTPTLVTTSTTATDEDLDGEIGQANTRILLGNDSFEDRMQPGGRLDFGMWWDDCRSCGIGTRFTALGDDQFNYNVTSATNNVLTIPFFNLDPAVNAEDTLIVAHPLTPSTGSINVQGQNNVLFGDLYLRRHMVEDCNFRVDFLGGYFYSQIHESLNITSTTAVGNNVVIRDNFRTKNEFHGGSIGLLGEFDRACMRVNVMAKIAMGQVHQSTFIDGSTTVDNGTPTTSGLFTQASNVGTRTRDEFSIVPELSINWAYKISCNVELTSGYSLVYWNNVLRPGDIIDRSVDNTQTQARPAANFNDSGYWAHGMNFGVNWVY